MPRYINPRKINLITTPIFSEDLELLIPISEVRKAIALTPTEDVTEVKHGQWREQKITMWTPGKKPYFRYQQECTVCGFINTSKKRWSSKFCPECGADMRKER